MYFASFVQKTGYISKKSNNKEVGFSMAKYSFEFKKKIVYEYLDGKDGSVLLAFIMDR